MAKRTSKPTTVAAPAAPSSPVPAKRAPMSGLDMAKIQAKASGRIEKANLPSPFAVAMPAPGVLPNEMKPQQIAMDSAFGSDVTMNVMSDWATSSILASASHEGVSFLGYPFLAQLAQRPEYRRMVETIARHMTRKWIKIQSKGGEDGKPDEEATPEADDKPLALSAASRAGIKPRIKKLGHLLYKMGQTRGEEAGVGPNGTPGDDKSEKIKIIEAEFERLKIKHAFQKAAEQDGYFGRGHIFIDLCDTGDRDELKTSVGHGDDDVTRIKVAKGTDIKAVKSIEAVWCYPSSYNASDPLSETWYRPDRWYVMGKEVHGTRLLTLISREVPDLLKPAYMFGGLSLAQIAKPYVDNWLKTRESVAKIISAFSVFVLKTKLLDQMTDEQSAQELFKRLQLFCMHRDNTGVMAVDKEDEDFANVSTSLSTLDALQAQTQEHMAAVSGIPLVELLGIQPAGLNASSEGEIETFYDWIHSCQESTFREPLTVIFQMIQLSKFGEIDPDLTFEFEKLRTMDEKEAADIMTLKVNAIIALVEASIISADEAREVIAEDDEMPFNGLDLTMPAPAPAPDADPFGTPPTPGGMGEGDDPFGGGESGPASAKVTIGADAASAAVTKAHDANLATPIAKGPKKRATPQDGGQGGAS